MKVMSGLAIIALLSVMPVPGTQAQSASAPLAPTPVVASQSAAIDEALLTLLGAADVRDYINTRRSEEIKAGVYQVRSGDTLSELIRRIYRDSAMRHDFLQQAIMHTNPHAFRNNNPNWMLAGARLRIPEANDVMALIFRDLDVVQARIQGGHPNWVRYP